MFNQPAKTAVGWRVRNSIFAPRLSFTAESGVLRDINGLTIRLFTDYDAYLQEFFFLFRFGCGINLECVPSF